MMSEVLNSWKSVRVYIMRVCVCVCVSFGSFGTWWFLVYVMSLITQSWNKWLGFFPFFMFSSSASTHTHTRTADWNQRHATKTSLPGRILGKVQLHYSQFSVQQYRTKKKKARPVVSVNKKGPSKLHPNDDCVWVKLHFNFNLNPFFFTFDLLEWLHNWLNSKNRPVKQSTSHRCDWGRLFGVFCFVFFSSFFTIIVQFALCLLAHWRTHGYMFVNEMGWDK